MSSIYDPTLELEEGFEQRLFSSTTGPRPEAPPLITLDTPLDEDWEDGAFEDDVEGMLQSALPGEGEESTSMDAEEDSTPPGWLVLL